MRSYCVTFSFFVGLFLTMTCPVPAQNSPANSKGSCRSSVQTFYDWYVAARTTEDRDWHVALEKKESVFSKDLAQSLRESDHESKTLGDPVLDFDPILGTQDMGNRYTVSSVAIKHDHCLAKVWGTWPRPVPDKGKEPNVEPELIFENGRWLFANFHYPGSDKSPRLDLLNILQSHYTK